MDDVSLADFLDPLNHAILVGIQERWYWLILGNRIDKGSFEATEWLSIGATLPAR
jgi:hypothetical protein